MCDRHMATLSVTAAEVVLVYDTRQCSSCASVGMVTSHGTLKAGLLLLPLASCAAGDTVYRGSADCCNPFACCQLRAPNATSGRQKATGKQVC